MRSVLMTIGIFVASACGRVVLPADAAVEDGPVGPAADLAAEPGPAPDGGPPAPDGGPPAPDAAADAPAEAALPACASDRAMTDRPDDSALDQIRALYVLPADGADDRLDIDGRICRSIESAGRWLAGQAGGARLRFDTSGGRLDIGFVRLALTDAELRGTGGGTIDTGLAYVRDRLERELTRLGQLAPNKLYAVYYGGSSALACGGGPWPPVLPGRVAALYLRGEPPGARPCADNPLGASATRPGYLDYAMLHELMHALGLVARGAPNEHAAGHVFDGAVPAAMAARDLMYAGRAGGDPGWATGDAEGLVLDMGRDDYYGHGAARSDLARSSLLEPLPAGGGERPPGW